MSDYYAPTWLGWTAAILGIVGIILGSVALGTNNNSDSITPTVPGQKGEPGTSITGAKGQKGDAGTNGTDGTKGDKGNDTGIKGTKGSDGEKGNTGDKGSDGEKGNTGEKGSDGEKGMLGEKGSDGEKGNTGEKGSDGAKGEKGEIGAAPNATVDLISSGLVANLASVTGKIRSDGDHMTVYYGLAVAGGAVAAGKICDVNADIHADLLLAVSSFTATPVVAAGVGLHFLPGGELHSAYSIPDGTVIEATCTMHGTILP